MCSWAKESSKCTSDPAGTVLGTCTLITDNFVSAVTRLQQFGLYDLITLRPDLKAAFILEVARPNYSALFSSHF